MSKSVKISASILIGGACFSLDEFGKTLESVKDLCSEIIVVNTSAPKEADELAARYGANIIHRECVPWDFAKARNWTLEPVTGDWLLVIDADETFERSVPIATIKRYLADTPYNAVALDVVDRRGGFDLSSMIVPRFFRRGKVYYEGVVHNQPHIIDGEERREAIHFPHAGVIHTGYDLTQEQKEAKFNRSYELIQSRWEAGDLHQAIYAAEMCGMMGEGKDGRPGYLETALEWCHKYFEVAEQIGETFNRTVFYLATSFALTLNNEEEAAYWLIEGLKLDPIEPNLNFLNAEMAQKHCLWDVVFDASIRHLHGVGRWMNVPTLSGNTFMLYIRPVHIAMSHNRIATISIARAGNSIRKLESMVEQLPPPLVMAIKDEVAKTLNGNEMVYKGALAAGAPWWNMPIAPGIEKQV